MQTEVGEAFEPSAPGKGGSSTVPHKRNPVGSAVILGATLCVPALVSVMLTAMVQEHERGMDNWHAEVEDAVPSGLEVESTGRDEDTAEPAL